jgi:hypothetical protein
MHPLTKKKKFVWMIGAKINFLKKYFNTFKKKILKITLIMILNIPKKV